jgi:hypothetical protein
MVVTGFSLTLDGGHWLQSDRGWWSLVPAYSRMVVTGFSVFLDGGRWLHSGPGWWSLTTVWPNLVVSAGVSLFLGVGQSLSQGLHSGYQVCVHGVGTASDTICVVLLMLHRELLEM